MIQLSALKLLVADDKGRPVELDMGLLEKRLADCFRKLGFSELWMAEDVSLTVKERIRQGGAMLTSSDVDSIVATVLDASGYSDVAREYALASRIGPLDGARRCMAPWRGRLPQVLSKALPLTDYQAEELARKCACFLENAGIALASDKFLADLAVHLLVAGEEGGAGGAPAASWKDGLGDGARRLLDSGVLRDMPVSGIFPRARLSVRLERLAQESCGGWISALSLSKALAATVPDMAEVLCAMRKGIARMHPMQADSPSHIVVADFSGFIGREASMWRRSDREELRSALAGVLDGMASGLDFQLSVTFR